MNNRYILIENSGNIQELSVSDEAVIMNSLQNRSSCNTSVYDKLVVQELLDKKVCLIGKRYDIYTKIKQNINETIQKEINPVEFIPPPIFLKKPRLVELQKLFGLKLFQCSHDLILPPATDFGLFSLLEDTVIVTKELSKAYYALENCFRFEDNFDNSLIRSYNFELPDIHVIVPRKTDFFKVIKQHLFLYKQILEKMQISYAVMLRITEEKFSTYLDEIKTIPKTLSKDILVHIITASRRYWDAKFKFVHINKENLQVQLSTVQIDYKISQLFNFKDEFGNHFIVIHSSPGSIQRLLYCFINRRELNPKIIT